MIYGGSVDPAERRRRAYVPRRIPPDRLIAPAFGPPWDNLRPFEAAVKDHRAYLGREFVEKHVIEPCPAVGPSVGFPFLVQAVWRNATDQPDPPSLGVVARPESHHGSPPWGKMGDLGR